MKDYVAVASEYVRGVLSGEIVACESVVLACDRHLADLERVGSDALFLYRFEPAFANYACSVIETFPHIKGKWEGELLKLEPWQCFVVCMLFGWLDTNGKRRFRKASIYISRKNAKSTLAAAIGLLLFAADDEPGAEVYSGATNKKQAFEVFTPARLQVKRTPAFARQFRIEVQKESLTITGSASRFEPVIGKPGDGASPHGALIDEYHEHPTADLYDTMLSGMGAREQPLLMVISSAGDSIEGPCYDDVLTCRDILEGTDVDEEHFVIIFEPDPDDEWESDAAMVKANPNLDVSVFRSYLESRRLEAIKKVSARARYRTKNLNQWVSARDAYYDIRKWRSLADRGWTLEALAGRECIIGVDIASKVDLTCLVYLFPWDDIFWISVPRFYLPEARLGDPKNEHYRNWAEAGDLVVTDGDMIDLPLIRDDLLELSGLVNVVGVGYDPHQATMWVNELEDEGVPCFEVRQTVLSLSEPMKETDALIRAGRLLHDGNPCQTWNIGNVVAKEDAKENVYPRKLKKAQKIDGAVAQIIAFALAGQDVVGSESVYEERGLLTVGV